MTITTAEIIERVQEIHLADGAEGRRVYNEAISTLELQWRTWLYQDAASALSTEALALIFQRAWEEGHGSGYQDVDVRFRDLVDLTHGIIQLEIDWPVAQKAEKLKIYVHRKDDGSILVASSDSTLFNIEKGDIVTEQDVWFEIPE